MIVNRFIIKICICLAIVGCNSNKEVSLTKGNNNQMVDYFADNGFGNAVAVVQHPAGVYHEGVTYLCYQGPLEDPYVAAYNHQTNEWKGPYKAGVSEMGKDLFRKKRIDNHGKPSMIIDDAGYIHITFGGHGGMRKHGDNPLGNHHYGKNLHAVSKRPLDISGWEMLDNIPPFGTYNQFAKMDNGDIYLFYRHGAHRSNWVYQKSTDNGRTFDKPVSFLKHKRRTDMEAEDSWYPWITRGKGDDLIVAFDYHLCRDARNNEDKRGHIPERHNLYYMVFDTKASLWKNVKGEPLNMPLIREEADEKALVAKTSSDWTFQAVVDLNPDGNPHVCVRVGAETGRRRSAPKSLHHFRWNGATWVQSKNAQLPVGGGDIELNSTNNVNIYLDDSRAGEVSRWDSFDAGDTFKKGPVLLRRNNSGFAISSLIDNAHPDAKIIVAEKESGTYFRKMYLLGDIGAIQRAKKEAEVLKNK